MKPTLRIVHFDNLIVKEESLFLKFAMLIMNVPALLFYLKLSENSKYWGGYSDGSKKNRVHVQSMWQEGNPICIYGETAAGEMST